MTPAQPVGTSQGQGHARPVTVLHLSDIHVGRHFNHDNWDDVRDIAMGVKPDLVVVTGDLVESPWSWRLKRAKQHLVDFREELRKSTKNVDLELLCIPGNHDTRVTGLLPVLWLRPMTAIAASALIVLFLYGIIVFGTAPADAPPLWRSALALLGGVTIAALVLMLCARANLAAALGSDLLIRSPRVLNGMSTRIGIVPFDSASHGLRWARGRVLSKDMVACKRAMEEAKRTSGIEAEPFWLAVVHHHPLPLPYDSKWEKMMVMDNAGALLSELSRRGIRLVLHGHKHHQHFARVTIDPFATRPVDVGVLSAGTPTQGSRPLAFRRGFNVLSIYPDHRVKIEMYEAEGGGTFVAKPQFDMVPLDDHARWRFGQDSSNWPLSCRRMVFAVEIDGYGDAHFMREFHGVRAKSSPVKEIGHVFPAHAGKGFVEAYRVESLSRHGPGVTVNAVRKSIHELEATIAFTSSGLQQTDDPIDFVAEFQANNSVALNRWHFSQMYPDRADFTEEIEFNTVSGFAAEELLLHVRFSPGAELPQRIDLRYKDKATPHVNGWLSLHPQLLVRMEREKVIQLRIPYPKANTSYQISWDLAQNAAVASAPPQKAGVALALGLRKKLRELEKGELSRDIIGTAAMAVNVCFDLAAENREYDFQTALFVYDEPKQTLRCLDSTYEPNDPRSRSSFPFGMGVAGRAFKKPDTVTFLKPNSGPREQPTGYVRGDGKHPETLDDIPEAAIIAVALAPPQASEWPYAVLQISTDDFGHPLARAVARQDSRLAILTLVMREELTRYVEHKLRPSTQGRTGPAPQGAGR